MENTSEGKAQERGKKYLNTRAVILGLRPEDPTLNVLFQGN